MDHYMSQRNGFAACEEVRRCTASPFMYGRRNPIVCPKPVRVLESRRQGELFDSTEILEILLAKESDESLDTLPVASPPYFCGSPPVRTANPLIHDPGFLQGKHYKQLTQPTPVERANIPLTTMASSAARSCSTTNFGPSPVAVRIEGFDCLNRDGRGRSISAYA